MNSLITLAICTYNNSQLLERTLEKLEQQKVKETLEWSAIVVDNNSTDHTQEIAQTYIDRGLIPQLRYVQEKQQGLAYARRRAIAETQSPWIALIDDDCWLSPDWVEQAVDFLKKHPQAGAIGGKVELLWEVPPEAINIQQQKSLSAQDWGDFPVQLPSKGWTYLVGAGLLIRRQAIQDSGWLELGTLVDRCERKLTSGGDIEMVLRIRKAGYELWYTPALKLQHYIPKTRMSAEYLYRLHRGFGESTNLLLLLAHDETPTWRWRMGRLYASLENLIRQVLGLAIKEWLLCRQASPTRLILIQRAIGDLEAAYQFLWKKYPL